MASKEIALKTIGAKTKRAGDKEQYQRLLKNIDSMMRKGEKKLSPKELAHLKAMAIVAEEYEDSNFPLAAPKNLSEMIELRMFQMKMNQTKAAQMLGVTNSKFSQILRGRRKPDIPFLKAVHKKLKVDAQFLLDKI